MVALVGNQKVVGLNLEVVYDVALFRNKWTHWVQLHIFPFTNDDRKVLWEYCNKMMFHQWILSYESKSGYS